LSVPFKAWISLVSKAILERADAARITENFKLLKRRQLLYRILKTWRHQTVFGHLEGLYSRTELMRSLAEQKLHVKALERYMYAYMYEEEFEEEEGVCEDDDDDDDDDGEEEEEKFNQHNHNQNHVTNTQPTTTTTHSSTHSPPTTHTTHHSLTTHHSPTPHYPLTTQQV